MMNEPERQALAEKLANMKYQRARNHLRRLDPQANLRQWRNAIGADEWHTVYDLPNEKVRVTLVERPEKVAKEGRTMVRSKPLFVEARVDPLPTQR